MTTFRIGQDAAVVEHDDATRKPREGGKVIPARVHGTNGVFTTIDSDREPWDEHPALFDTDSGWAARAEYVWRLVSLCHRCQEPITGEPVTEDRDPLGREWCSDECHDDSGQAWMEQHYRSA